MGRERKRIPKDERRKRIVELSKRVFAKYGFRKTTMEDISREIGFTAAAIYYYFESKEELFKTCISDEIGKIIEKIEMEIQNLDNPVEKIKRIIETKVNGTRELIRILNINDEILGELKSEIERLGMKEFVARESKIIENVIKEGIDKEIFRQVDTRRVAFLIHIIAKELSSSGGIKRKDIDEIVEIILKGIQVK